jgi:hypothetical protein
MTTIFRLAEILIEAIEAGRITTSVQLSAWVSSTFALPPHMREYVFHKIEPSIGPNGISYLRSLLPAAPPVEAAA